jgi:hypothetical protein
MQRASRVGWLSGMIVLGIALMQTEAAQTQSAYTYPLKLSANGRLLVDQKNKPFLVQGDSPWSLLVQLTLEEAEQYLEDRRQKGFNLVMVNLIEHQFCDKPPFNKKGDAPFRKPGDFATPNEAYFAHADAVIRLAAQKGIVVLLAPAYLGVNGGNEGWYQEMVASGVKKLREYGRYVGKRYKKFDNIVWLNGGDYNPADAKLVQAVAEGIRQEDNRHLHTAHCGPGSSALDVYPAASWLALNTTYAYDEALYGKTLADYNRTKFKPFLMLESAYENEHEASPARLRRQAYWAMLTGATGQIFGNRPLWLFGEGWQEALNSTGSQDMARVGNLFRDLRWYDLVPDQKHETVVDGYGTLGSTDYVTAAHTPDGALVVAYIPATGVQRRTLRVNMAGFPRRVRALWYNPTRGAYTFASPGLLDNTGVRNFTTPGHNGAGANDWVLLLKAQDAS